MKGHACRQGNERSEPRRHALDEAVRAWHVATGEALATPREASSSLIVRYEGESVHLSDKGSSRSPGLVQQLVLVHELGQLDAETVHGEAHLCDVRRASAEREMRLGLS